MTLYQPPSKNAIQKTLTSTLTAGVIASAALSDVTGVQNAKGVFVVDRIDANGNLTPSKREYIAFDGTSGSTVTNLTRNVDGGGTDQTHAVGAIVEFVPDVVQQQGIYDALANLVNPATGALDTTKVVATSGAQTIDGVKTFSSDPIIPDEAYGTGWNGSLEPPTKNAVYDKIESMTLSPDGWTPTTDTLVYVSASSFKITGADRTTIYTKGTRIKLTQTTVKYFVVTSSSFSTDTTVNITGGTDYTLANAAITIPYYSYQVNPQGYPAYFNYTFTVTPESGSITTYTDTGIFSVVGGFAYVDQKISITNNGTGSGGVDATLPIQVAADLVYTGYGREYNSTGKQIVGLCRTTGSGLINWKFYDNTYPGGTGSNILTGKTIYPF